MYVVMEQVYILFLGNNQCQFKSSSHKYKEYIKYIKYMFNLKDCIFKVYLLNKYNKEVV